MSAEITVQEQLALAGTLLNRAHWNLPTGDPYKFDAERKETLRGVRAQASRATQLISDVLDEIDGLPDSPPRRVEGSAR